MELRKKEEVMNSENPTIAKTSPGSLKMLQAMVGIGVLCALLIVLTFEKTLPAIEKNKAEALEKAIFKVIPGITKTKTYQFDQNNKIVAVTNENEVGPFVYAGFNDRGEFTGLAIEASGLGYADIIRILYGYQPETEKIIGFYVLETKETPGLGDKIEKDENFLANFKDLDVSLTDDQSILKHQVVTVKHDTKENPWEIDGITGATISSRAIGDIIGSSTQHWIPLIYKNKEKFILNENEKTN